MPKIVGKMVNFAERITDGYREVSYNLPADLSEPMGKFTIKVCMYADGAPLNTAIVPIIKDLRAIALA